MKRICVDCNIEIPKKLLVRSSGARGYRNLCKTCRNKRNRENARKRAESLKLYRSFYS